MERNENPNFTRCFTLGATLVSQKQARALSKPCKAVIPSFPLLGMDSPCADELVALCNCMWQNQIQYFITDWKKKREEKRAFSTNNAAQCCCQLYTEISDRACTLSSLDKNKPVF